MGAERWLGGWCVRKWRMGREGVEEGRVRIKTEKEAGKRGKEVGRR
jgi:hypothetical protein